MKYMMYKCMYSMGWMCSCTRHRVNLSTLHIILHSGVLYCTLIIITNARVVDAPHTSVVRLHYCREIRIYVIEIKLLAMPG